MNRVVLVLDLVMLGMAALVVGEVAIAVAGRLTWGYDLEWMEGATLLTGLRARDGLPFYTEPSVDYIPFIYPPLYAWVLGLLGHILPFGYTLGRAVSVTGTLAAVLAIVYGARSAGARWPLSVGCAALFVGTYENTGTFFDLVRTDGLAMGLLAWALVLAPGGTRVREVSAGLLLALAFAAKHHAAMFGLPIALFLWWRDGWRHALTFGVAAAAPALLFTLGMEAATRRLFVTYLLEVPSVHGLVRDRMVPSLSITWSPFAAKGTGAAVECLLALPFTTILGLALPAWMARGRIGPYWVVVSLTALVTVSLMRGHTGGFVNVLMPMFWAQALWPALVSATATSRWIAPIAAICVTAQLWEGRAPLGRYVPTEEDGKNAAALIEELRELPEPLLIPHAPYYAVLAGKAPGFALICLWDINHDGGPFKGDVGEIQAAMAAHHWASIVLPDDKLGYGLKEGYERARLLRSRAFGVKTGWGVRLRQVWVPKEE